jgi:hypothetical protein
MTNGASRRRNWTATIAWAVLLILAGVALAIWGLSRWDAAARFLGVAPEQEALALRTAGPALAFQAPPPVAGAVEQRIAALESRLAAAESESRSAAGSAGRADALLVAFAARRAIDRGVPLGYLEPLLAQRFGPTNARAVAAVIAASRDPVTLDRLTADYLALEPELRRGPPEESLLRSIQRELGTLVAVHRANSPSPMNQARYGRALDHLGRGEVDRALAETMRLPGAARAAGWTGRARRYIAAHRALDEIESAALMAGPA